MKQVLFPLPEYTCSSLFLCGVRVTKSFVFCVVFCRSFVNLSISSLSLGQCAFLCNEVSDHPFGISVPLYNFHQ